MKPTDLRGILQYIPRFRKKTFVIAADGVVVTHVNFANLLLDIAVLHSLNIRVVLVHGAAEQIAQLAAEKSASPRDSSTMLLVSGSSLSDKCIRNLSDVFSAGDLFVINNTRVLSSRLRGKVNNYSVEVTFLNEVKKGIWRSLVKPAKRLSIGDSFFFNDYKIKVFKKEIRGEVLFEVNMDKTKFIELLLKKGEMPLPPYLKNNKMKNPFEDYQTIFAKKYGAEVPFMRPKSLATDAATSDDVLVHTINQLFKMTLFKIKTLFF